MNTGFDGYRADVAIKWWMVWDDRRPWQSYHEVDLWIGTTLLTARCSMLRWQAWWCWFRTRQGAELPWSWFEWALNTEFPAVPIDHEPFDASPKTS